MGEDRQRAMAMQLSPVLLILLGSYVGLAVSQNIVFEAADAQSLSDVVAQIEQAPVQEGMELNITVELAAGRFQLDGPLYFRTPESKSGSSLTIRGAGVDNTVVTCHSKRTKGLVIFGWTTNVTVEGVRFRKCQRGALLIGSTSLDTDEVEEDLPPAAPEAPSLDSNGTDSVIRNLLQVEDGDEKVEELLRDEEAEESDASLFAILVSDCTFEDNSGGVIQSDGTDAYFMGTQDTSNSFYIPTSRSAFVTVTFAGVTFSKNRASEGDKNDAPTVSLSRMDEVVITDCRFQNNSNTQDILYLGINDVTIIHRTTFVDNKAARDANIALISNSAQVMVLESSFQFNAVRNAAYVAMFSGNANVGFLSSQLSYNYGNGSGSFGLLRFHDGDNLEVIDCLFQGNLINGSTGGVTAFVSAFENATWTNASFVENEAPSTGGLVFYNTSMGLLKGCIFEGNVGRQRTGALAASQSDTISLTDCYLQRNKGGNTGGASMIGVASVIMTDSVMENNVAGPGGVGATYVQLSQELVLSNVTLNNNTGEGSHGVGGAIFMQVLEVLIQDSDLISNTVGGEFAVGGAYIADCPHVHVHRSSFVSNTNVGGDYARGALYVGNASASLQLLNSTFDGNWAAGYFSVGAVYAVSGPSVYVFGCDFRNNSGRADLSKGALRFIDIGNALVHNSTFLSNIADCDPDNKRDPHKAYGQVSGSFNFLMCGGAAIFAYQSKVTVVSCYFEDNKALTLWAMGGAVFMYSSTLHIFDSLFYDNSAASGGALAGVAGSMISIDAPVFTGEPCNEDLEGPAIRLAWPFLFDLPEMDYLEGSRFERNTAMSGGAVAVFESTLATSFFVASKCTTKSAVTTTFTRNRALSGGAITSLRNPRGFFIVKSNLSNNRALASMDALREELGGEDGWRVSDKLSGAAAGSLGCGAGNGGAICFSTTWLSGGINQAIADSLIVGNRAQYGGGVYITADELQCLKPDECNLLYLTGLQFCGNTTGLNDMTLYAPAPGNKMLESTETRLRDNAVAKGAGGGIYLEHVHLAHIQCNNNESVSLELSHIEPSVCTEDYSHEPLLQRCDSWKGNEATSGGYGGLWATTPVTYTLDAREPEQLTYYSSQSKLPFKVRLWDFFENEIDVAAVNPSQSGLTLITMEVTNCSKCEVLGTLSIEAGVRPGELPYKQSTLTFSAMPGEVNVSVVASVPKLKRELPGMVFQVEVRKCHIGEYTAANGELCLWCEAGQYNLEPTATSCQVCPDDAICVTETTEGAMNAIIAPMDFYFNSNPFSSQILECPSPRACKYAGRLEAIKAYQAKMLRQDPYSNSSLETFNQSEYYTLLCAEGYSGPVCASCAEGYGSVGIAGKCIKCSYNAYLAGFMLFVSAFISVIPLFLAMHGSMLVARQHMALGSMRVICDEDEHRVNQESVIKVLISYFQILGMLGWIKIDVGSDTEDLIGGMQGITDKVVSAANTISSVRCTGDKSIDQQLMAMILSFVVPIAGFITVSVVYAVLEVYKDEVRALREKVMGCIIPKRWQRKEEEALDVGGDDIEAMEGIDNPLSLPSNKAAGPVCEGLEEHAPALPSSSQTASHPVSDDSESAGQAAVQGLVVVKNRVLPAVHVQQASQALPKEVEEVKGAHLLGFSSRLGSPGSENSSTDGYPTNSSDVAINTERAEHIASKDSGNSSAETEGTPFPNKVMVVVDEEMGKGYAGDEEMNDDEILELISNSKYQKMSIFTVLVIAGIVSSFLYYPDIIQQTILIFTCYHLDLEETSSELAYLYGMNTQSRWIMNYEQVCYDGSHLWLTLLLGVPGLLFVLGAPLGSWLLLYRNQHRFDHADFIGRYSFLYKDFSPRFYYWESIDMLRKLFISAALVILSDREAPVGTQVISALTVALLGLVLHLIYHPHKSHYVHKLEGLSHISISITMLYCIYFSYPVIPDTYAWITFAIGLMNVVTVFILGVAWIKAFVDGFVREAGLDPDEIRTMKSGDLRSRLEENEEEGERRSRHMKTAVSGGLLAFYKTEDAVKRTKRKLSNAVSRILGKPQVEGDKEESRRSINMESLERALKQAPTMSRRSGTKSSASMQRKTPTSHSTLSPTGNNGLSTPPWKSQSVSVADGSVRHASVADGSVRQASGPGGLRHASGPVGMRQASGPVFNRASGAESSTNSTTERSWRKVDTFTGTDPKPSRKK